MAEFTYRALAADGKEVRGTVTSKSREIAADKLMRQGLTPVSVTERGGALWNFLNTDIQLGRALGADDRVALIRSIARLLSAGIPLERALAILREGETKGALKDLLKDLQEGIRKGEAFSSALGRHEKVFPAYVIQTVAAGEASGALDQVMMSLATTMERTHKFDRELKSALIYPGILMAMIALTFVIVVFVVLPQFEAIFADAGGNLPFLTRAVMSLGNGLAVAAPYIMILGILASVMLVHYAKSSHGRVAISKRLAHLPKIGPILIAGDAARFARTTGVLLIGGVALDRAYAMGCGVVKNAWLRGVLAPRADDLRKGQRFATAFSGVGALPPLLLQLARVGDETGRLGPMLSEAAEILEEENDARLKRFLAIFVPVMTLGLGALVAIMIGSVLMGLLALNDLPF